MSPTTHALLGAIVGRVVRRPAGAFLAGAASHSLLDCLPHKDTRHPASLLIHACGVLGVLATAFAARDSAALAGALGGVLPDLENIREKGPEDQVFPGHRFDHDRFSVGVSLAVEILVAAGAILALGVTRSAPAGAAHRKTVAGVLRCA